MGNKINHAEPMAPEEVLRRAEAFDPLPIEPLGCPCEFCAATKRMKHEHAIMRLALEMIAQKCEQRARFGDRDTLNMIQRTAEQALRECEK